MSDPVSWLLIEPGWRVVDAEGERVGSVEQVVADRDIFSGLAVSVGLLGAPRWVTAESVAEITDGVVRLGLGRDDVKRLAEYDATPELD